jgi:hypothetical protein
MQATAIRTDERMAWSIGNAKKYFSTPKKSPYTIYCTPATRRGKASPSGHRKFSDEAKAMIGRYYATLPRIELLKLLPDRTWYSIQKQGLDMGLKREVPANDDLLPAICYSDLAPRQDGQYLFRDYETTVAYVKEAIRNTSRLASPLYAVWILPEKVEDMLDLVEPHLGGSEQAEPAGVNWTKRRSSRTC